MGRDGEPQWEVEGPQRPWPRAQALVDPERAPAAEAVSPQRRRQEQSRAKTTGEVRVPGTWRPGVVNIQVAVEGMNRKGTKERREEDPGHTPEEHNISGMKVGVNTPSTEFY